MKAILILLLFSASSCSRVNQKSQDHIGSKRMRHGVIPLAVVSREQIDQSSIERGEKIYMQKCLQCHGKSGEGDGALAPRGTANLRKLVTEVKNFKFFMSISQWQGDMPGWENQFTSAESDDLVAYIKTLR
jgi:mono/diheme cytochrome c family protein